MIYNPHKIMDKIVDKFFKAVQERQVRRYLRYKPLCNCAKKLVGLHASDCPLSD